MKKIGLLGGMNCESTVEYYKIINQKVREILGKTSSAKIIMESFNFKEIEDLQFQNNWDELTKKLSKAAQNLEKCNADYIVICTNLMHKIAPEIQKNIDIPIIHIVDSVAQEINNYTFNKVGLLGTIFTMEEDFYSKKLLKDYNIETIIPEKEDREEISRIIYEELCQGIIKNSSKEKYLQIINKLKGQGAQGVILGCTEIPLLIKSASIPLFNTLQIHALDAVSKSLKTE
ncbi:MAG: aspartate/glutamate racemase family protein [bacterium]